MNKHEFINNQKGKCNVGCCLVYPESAPIDWINNLRHWHIPACISPLHDHDTYDTDKYRPITDDNGELLVIDGEEQWELVHHMGEYKKPHYHVMVAYSGNTTFNMFHEIFDSIGGVVAPWDRLRVVHPLAMERYFTHIDDPDKYQYDPAEIVRLGGWNVEKYMTWEEKQKPFEEIFNYLYEHPEIGTYGELCRKLRCEKDKKLFYFATCHTVALKPIVEDLRRL